MDINEFSVACKLITMKLKGFEVPQVLPISLKNILSGTGTTTTPMLSPTNSGLMSPTQMMPMRPIVPIVPQSSAPPMMGMMGVSTTAMTTGVPVAIPPQQPQPVMPMNMYAAVPPVIPAAIPPATLPLGYDAQGIFCYTDYCYKL